jgi:hypothetical protein
MTNPDIQRPGLRVESAAESLDLDDDIVLVVQGDEPFVHPDMIDLAIQPFLDEKDMVFIDDNVTHLVAPKQESYPVLMSTWGGVLPEYISMANHHNIKMLAITEIKKLMPN